MISYVNWQPLVNETNIGFNYEMTISGSGRTEATKSARLELARLWLGGKIAARPITVVDEAGVSHDLIVFGDVDRIGFVEHDYDGQTLAMAETGVLKGVPLGLADGRILAWLPLNTEGPAPGYMVMKAIDGLQTNVEAFLLPAVKHLQREADKSASRAA